MGIIVYLLRVSPNTRIEINKYPRSTGYIQRVYMASMKVYTVYPSIQKFWRFFNKDKLNASNFNISLQTPASCRANVNKFLIQYKLKTIKRKTEAIRLRLYEDNCSYFYFRTFPFLFPASFVLTKIEAIEIKAPPPNIPANQGLSK